jgi:phospholipid/cholesterol/gamma-HCH transport system substrate-binding protein
MSPKARNVSVGLVVLVSLVVLVWMILRFGANLALPFQPAQIKVTFTAERGDGLGEGSAVNYKGVAVGRLIADPIREPDTDKIIIKATLYKDPPLPANMVADIVFSSPLGGTSSLNLRIKPSEKPQGTLADGANLDAYYLGSTFLPPEFAELARNLNESVRQFNDAKLIDKLAVTVDETRQQITKAGAVIDGASKFINNPEMQEDVRKSLASIRVASDNARQITERINAITQRIDSIADNTDKAIGSARSTFDSTQKRIDELASHTGQQLVKVSQLLDNVNSISAKIDKGTGTAGALVNDPKLYQALLDSTRELDGTLSDLRRLAQQWEQEGITLKLGK